MLAFQKKRILRHKEMIFHKVKYIVNLDLCLCGGITFTNIQKLILLNIVFFNIQLYSELNVFCSLITAMEPKIYCKFSSAICIPLHFPSIPLFSYRNNDNFFFCIFLLHFLLFYNLFRSSVNGRSQFKLMLCLYIFKLYI